MDVFDKYLKTDATKRTYRYHWNRFTTFSRHKDCINLSDKRLYSLIEEYILHLKKTVSPNSMTAILSAIEFVYSMNDKVINFKKLRRMLPARIKKTGFDKWKTTDIREMIKIANSPRNRALIYFLCSTGARKEAIIESKIKDMTTLEKGCCSITFYPGSTDEYTAYLTPEAFGFLKAYHKTRLKLGSEDYIFTNLKDGKLGAGSLNDNFRGIISQIPED